jgi:hypothetical protein
MPFSRAAAGRRRGQREPQSAQAEAGLLRGPAAAGPLCEARLAPGPLAQQREPQSAQAEVGLLRGPAAAGPLCEARLVPGQQAPRTALVEPGLLHGRGAQAAHAPPLLRAVVRQPWWAEQALVVATQPGEPRQG